MSRPDKSSATCQVCSSESVEFWEDLETRICSACGYVLQDGESDVGGNPAGIETTADSANSYDESTWEDRVSITDKSEANLVDVLRLTEELVETLTISESIASRAAEIVTRAWETNFMHGRTKESTASAALYAASREIGVGIPPGAISESVELEKSSVKDVYKDLRRDQDLDIDPSEPREYVDYICASLGLSEAIRETAITLLAKHEYTGGNPIGVAAAGVYEANVAEGQNATLREVASEVSLTKETVWRHADELRSD